MKHDGGMVGKMEARETLGTSAGSELLLQSNKMGVLPEGRLLFSMSLPVVISMLLQALYNVVDSIFVTRVSEDALTAVSLAFPIQMLMIAVAVGTGVGMNALISRKLGEQRYAEANAAATNGLFILFVSFLVFLLFGLFGVRPFLTPSWLTSRRSTRWASNTLPSAVRCRSAYSCRSAWSASCRRRAKRSIPCSCSSPAR